jgi:hypothetical protein
VAAHEETIMESKVDYITEVQEALEMLKTNEQIRVKDESNDHKYFTITPRIVKAYARNPHDLALWETIKDIAGESGECYLNTEQLAILGGMSTGQVSNSRKYWLKIGFLKGETRKDPGYSQSVWHLSVPDLWQKNIEWCEKHPKIEDRIAFRKAHRSLHRVKASRGEGKGSGSETKKKEVKKIDLSIKSSLDLFAGYFGKFLSQKELERWTTIFEAVGKDRAEELAGWAFKKEIHLTNRGGLLDSLETAAKNWREKQATTQQKGNQPHANRTNNPATSKQVDPQQWERDAELGRQILAQRAAQRAGM